MSRKLNQTANFWAESKFRLAQRKLLLKIDCLFTLFLLSSARKIDKWTMSTISLAESQPICFLFGACHRLACDRIPAVTAAAVVIAMFICKQS